MINEEMTFEEDRAEIVSKLSEAKMDFNIYDYGLDELLAHIQEVEYMENFGDKVRG